MALLWQRVTYVHAVFLRQDCHYLGWARATKGCKCLFVMRQWRRSSDGLQAEYGTCSTDRQQLETCWAPICTAVNVSQLLCLSYLFCVCYGVCSKSAKLDFREGESDAVTLLLLLLLLFLNVIVINIINILILILIIMIMKNFNRRNFIGHHGLKRRELAQHLHSHRSNAFSHTLYINTVATMHILLLPSIIYLMSVHTMLILDRP